MKLLPSLLSIPLLLLLPLMVATSPASAQRKDCVWTVQGRLEESDPRVNGSNAPFDLHTFSAERGDKIYAEVESTDFNSGVTLFQITNGNEYNRLSSDTTGTGWQLFSAWIYEDGEYAIRVDSINYHAYPPGQEPDRKFGNYTLQLRPVVCSQ